MNFILWQPIRIST